MGAGVTEDREFDAHGLVLGLRLGELPVALLERFGEAFDGGSFVVLHEAECLADVLVGGVAGFLLGLGDGLGELRLVLGLERCDGVALGLGCGCLVGCGSGRCSGAGGCGGGLRGGGVSC